MRCIQRVPLVQHARVPGCAILFGLLQTDRTVSKRKVFVAYKILSKESEKRRWWLDR
jgi:hypothetical protein